MEASQKQTFKRFLPAGYFQRIKIQQKMERKTALLNFFTISVAAFDFAATVSKATGGGLRGSEIESMHRALLSELTKPEPNMIWVELELLALQSMVENNAQARSDAMQKKFPPGGVFSES